MTLVVLDPGHGGRALAGRSTPHGAVGRAGLLEKDVMLDLAQRMVRTAPAGVDACLTRNDDYNLSLARRAEVAKIHRAQILLSLHVNAAPDPEAREGWVIVHPESSPRCRALGAHVGRQLAEGAALPNRLLELAVAVLNPNSCGSRCAACLVELGFLTHPATERRLLGATYREVLAAAIWRGVGALLDAGSVASVPRRALGGSVRGSPTRQGGAEPTGDCDLLYQVPLVPQQTGMSCWAAAAAMLVGWRACHPVEPRTVAGHAQKIGAFRDGLLPTDVEAFARAWRLQSVMVSSLTPGVLAHLLRQWGPLWLGEADPGLHVVVVVGICGDGTEQGTFVRINDPWPVGLGERYTLPFAQLAESFHLARRLGGAHVQLLHSGGRQVAEDRSSRTAPRWACPAGHGEGPGSKDREWDALRFGREPRTGPQGSMA